MTSSAPPADSRANAPRVSSTRAAMLIGLPLGGCVLLVVHYGVFQHELLQQHQTHEHQQHLQPVAGEGGEAERGYE